MTTATLAPPAVAEWLKHYDQSLLDERSSGEPDWLRANRRRAFEALKNLAPPTPFDEAWRRTDPALFPLDATSPAQKMHLLDEPAEADEWSEAFDLVADLTPEGLRILDRQGLNHAAIRVLPLQDAPVEADAWLNGPALPPATGFFEALNGAFWNAGLLIDIPAGYHLEKGILLRYRAGQAGPLWLPRIVVRLGEGASATILEHRVSASGEAGLAVTAREMTLEAGSRLKAACLNDWDMAFHHIGFEMARVDREAQVDLVSVNLGSKCSKLMFGSEVVGPGAAAELDGLFFVNNDQHIDQTSLQIHASPDTYSRLLYKGAAGGQGHSVYQGVIQAKPGAIRVDAYQTNNNIVLGDEARVDTIPGLLIDADDLKCSHGATIGTLDEDQIFYLRTRGLDAEAASHLVLMGFFEEIVDRVPYALIQERIHERLRARALKSRD